MKEREESRARARVKKLRKMTRVIEVFRVEEEVKMEQGGIVHLDFASCYAVAE